MASFKEQSGASSTDLGKPLKPENYLLHGPESRPTVKAAVTQLNQRLPEPLVNTLL